MPVLALLLALAVLALALTGRLKAEGLRWAVGALGAFFAAELLVRGGVIPALLVGAGTAWWVWREGLKTRVAAMPMEEAEARGVLGVGASAGRDEIVAAHRRLITSAHPDKGGSAELARRVNAARDRLLKGKK